jgi:hypothetical protein
MGITPCNCTNDPEPENILPNESDDFKNETQTLAPIVKSANHSECHSLDST